MSDWLTKQLEGQAYVPDGGFTDRVLGALPPPERRMFSASVWRATASSGRPSKVRETPMWSRMSASCPRRP